MEGKYPQKVTLRKSNLAVVLRPLEQTDEANLIQFFSNLPEESTAFLKDNVRDPEVVKKFIREHNPETIWSILALAPDGKIVGDATLHMSHHGWRRHVGEIRVVVGSEFRKQGLATTLIHELVNQAGMRKLKKLEAQMLDNQIGARTAFEHLGFREEARLKNHAMDLSGQLHDVLILTHTVEDLWSKMENLINDLELGRGLAE